MLPNSAPQRKRQCEWLKDYQWKPGQSGNPAGGKPGKQLKTWAREFLMELPDEKKLEFLKHMPPEVVWKMAEGNPQEDITTGGEKIPTPILNILTKDAVLHNDSDKEDSPPQ